MEKPSLESIKNEEKSNPTTENKVNAVEEKPETPQEKTLTITKDRLKQSIDRYSNKLKELKTANEAEKEKLNKELSNIKAELKKEKNTYEQVKKDFFASTNYNVEKFTAEDLQKVPSRRYRFETRKGKLFNTPKINKMKTIRRNMTIRKLIKKFNKIGEKSKDGVRFIM